jgi:hypothetical protein
MKITAPQLKQIIKEELEKQFFKENYGPGLGAYADLAVVDSANRALDALRKNVEKNAIEEGMDELDAEDLARDALAQLFEEFMSQIGYGE